MALTGHVFESKSVTGRQCGKDSDMLCVFHTPPLTVAANQEPSGCGTTLSMADDDVMAVASELVEEKNKRGRGKFPNLWDQCRMQVR